MASQEDQTGVNTCVVVSRFVRFSLSWVDILRSYATVLSLLVVLACVVSSITLWGARYLVASLIVGHLFSIAFFDYSILHILCIKCLLYPVCHLIIIVTFTRFTLFTDGLLPKPWPQVMSPLYPPRSVQSFWWRIRFGVPTGRRCLSKWCFTSITPSRFLFFLSCKKKKSSLLSVRLEPTK